ncbi:MAG: hypothetical protein K0S27_1031 [Gammaproteobacteria bacterium]|nr:hypothetical protein [Gammaproteobacteria bacterium]
MNSRKEIPSLGITHICFLGNYDPQDGSFAALYGQYLQNVRPGALYCVAKEGKLFVAMEWPAAYREIDPEASSWVELPSFLSANTLAHLVKLSPTKSYSIEELPAECHAEVNRVVETLEIHVKRQLQGAETRRKEAEEQNKTEIQRAKDAVFYLFERREEEHIKQFFGADLLYHVKELKTLFCPNEEWDKTNGSTDALRLGRLVRALKATPSQKMTPEEASNDEAVKEIAAAAAALREWVPRMRYKDTFYNRERWYTRHRVILRIITSILLIAPGALGGFKAGAALGAVAGGGIASAPTALIGGCVGALIGGLGLFAGVKKFTAKSPACRQYIHAVLIDMAVRDVLPCAVS